MKLNPARAQSTLYSVDATRSIADDAGKTDATLMPGGRRFRGIVTPTADAPILLHSIVCFLLLDVTVFLKPMNVSEATRQLSCHLAFNLHNFGLSQIELKLEVGLNIIVAGRS